MDKTIALKDVRDALMCAMVRRAGMEQGQRPMTRMAAFSANPMNFGPDCRHPWRDALPNRLRLGFMSGGCLLNLVHGTHTHHGAREVRHIWGKGLRALQVELLDGCTR